MAKKKSETTKSSPAKKASRPSAGKPAARSPSKKSPPKQQHQHCQHEEEIELDETEREAVNHVIDSKKVRDALENEVNRVVTQAVRKICKAHGTSLSDAQAQNVAMVLFGD